MSARFRKRMKELRTNLGMTLRETSTATEVGHVTIFNIETGHITNPGIFTVLKLARCYNVTLEDLIK